MTRAYVAIRYLIYVETQTPIIMTTEPTQAHAVALAFLKPLTIVHAFMMAVLIARIQNMFQASIETTAAALLKWPTAEMLAEALTAQLLPAKIPVQATMIQVQIYLKLVYAHMAAPVVTVVLKNMMRLLVAFLAIPLRATPPYRPLQ